MDELNKAFDILKRTFKGYEDRPQQVEMAAEVLACLKDKKNLLAEAGTGVGKSFAYLIPAILSEKKTIVSTASIALQDQLVKKDLSFLRNSLPHKFSFSVLKGKNNYLCLKREREYPELGESYGRFNEWVSETQTGDKDELSFIPDFWSKVCGDSDDCGSSSCPFYSECFYYNHYKGLFRSDILVVNHHLLIFDLLSGFKLLPFHGQLVVDEAHQLENVISNVFGTVLNHSRMMWLLFRLKGLKIAVDQLFDPVDMFFKARRAGAQTICPIPDSIIDELENLKGMLAPGNIINRLNAYKESISDDELKDRVETTINCVGSLENTIEDFIAQADKDKVYYMSMNRGTMELKSGMVESQRPFSYLVDGYDSMIMTSATLTAGGNFGFIKKRLGIADPGAEAGKGFREMVTGSPFDYKKQSVLYIDKELPLPNKEDNEAVWQEGLKIIEGLIEASSGRALVLFTSYRHLNFASEHIDIGYPFKAQGEEPPAKLIRWFKKTPGSVLLATATFWQGIDIKGDQLSLVIIVKMPFGSPGDPVYDERCKRLGERWFSDLALPSAILMLRQGIGRLIRGADDYGVVAILDPRVVRSSYGKTVLSSLPDMDVVHEIGDVGGFFQKIREQNNHLPPANNPGEKRYNRSLMRDPIRKSEKVIK